MEGLEVTHKRATTNSAEEKVDSLGPHLFPSEIPCRSKTITGSKKNSLKGHPWDALLSMAAYESSNGQKLQVGGKEVWCLISLAERKSGPKFESFFLDTKAQN